MKIFMTMLAIMTIFAKSVLADEIKVSHFAAEGLSGWESKSFKGTTEYSLLKDAGKTVVKAMSHSSASGMIRKISFQPTKHRYLRWSWKIAETIKNGDEKSKGGDDYAARVYVLFPGKFFWQMKAINYIWANKLPKGKSIPNAYTKSAMMLAVESGNEKKGQWLMEERDLVADYRTLFGGEPPEAEAIAIMTDSDNTGSVAEAWYGDIILSTTAK